MNRTIGSFFNRYTVMYGLALVVLVIAVLNLYFVFYKVDTDNVWDTTISFVAFLVAFWSGLNAVVNTVPGIKEADANIGQLDKEFWEAMERMRAIAQSRANNFGGLNQAPNGRLWWGPRPPEVVTGPHGVASTIEGHEVRKIEPKDMP